MPPTGISLGGDPTARWLEANPSAVDCLEIAAEGFFARPSPYLRWLASRFPLIVRASGPSTGTSSLLNPEQLASLAAIGAAAQARFVVYPLGFCEAGEIRLNTWVPISLTPTSLGTVAERIAQATATLGSPALVEPITAPLRVPGTLGETDFLTRLCRKAGCRLFIDVTTLQVASRNHGFDPHDWLTSLPVDLIAGARIGGARYHQGRWLHDVRGDIDEAAWALMADLASRANPDVLLLGVRERPGGIDELGRDLDRLRRINREAARTSDSSGRDHPDAAARITLPRGEPTARTTAPAAPIDRTDRPGITPDVALFVLDDEGVFFSESRRELSLFNTPATLVWCLLEEGQTVSEITQAYRDAFGVEEQEASRHVGTILQRWFGLGYITEPASLPGDEVPLSTALAQVLTNARLRSLFRQSPSGVAEALRVSREDVDTFTALDPDEIDAQAEEVARHRSASMHRGTASGGAALERDGVPDADTRDSSSKSREEAPNAGVAARPGRRYRLLTTTFEIRVSSDDEVRGARGHSSVLADRIHDALAHLECLDGSTPDVALELRPSSSGGWTIFDEDVPVAQCRGAEDAVPAMKLLLRETAVNRHPFLVSVHAGVVSFGDGCVLLPASAGSGKTTLTAALIRSGATYFSDEIALLEEGTLAVRPVPLALTIKDGSVAPLRALYPEIDTLTPHVREDYVRVRYLSPPAESLPADDTPHPVRWIVFPRFTEGTGTELRPLTRPAALRRLLDESFLPLEQLDRGKVDSLVQWMRTVECFELPLSSLDEAVSILRKLMSGRGSA